MKVDRDNYWDRIVEELGEEGFTDTTIASLAKLSVGQVSYRRQQFGVRTMDYRRGTSAVARKKISNIRARLAKIGLNTRRTE